MTKYVQYISTFGILAPILVGLLRYKRVDSIGRLFLFFLLYGFLADIFVGMILPPNQLSYFIFKSYSVFEAVFLFWFIMRVDFSKRHHSVIKILLIIAVAVWFVTNYILVGRDELSNLFDPFYEIIISFYSGYFILQIIEMPGNGKVNLPVFWFLVGIFVYCFCTFFITMFLSTSVQNKVWFLHDIINVVIYLIYAKAFWLYKPKSVS